MASAPARAERPVPDARGASARLEGALRALAEQYALLEAIGGERIAAVRRADLPAIGAAMGRENEVVQRIASLDQARGAAASELAGAVGAPAGEGARASALAQRGGEPARGALLEAAGALRSLVERVHEQSRRAFDGAQALASHMQGLIRLAERRLSHSGAYGRRGVVEPGPAVVSALDVMT